MSLYTVAIYRTKLRQTNLVNISEFLTFVIEMKYHPYMSGRGDVKRPLTLFEK